MTQKVKITLIENGIHSFTRGLYYINEYKVSEDQYDLRDAILFLHNGVELLLKDVLKRENEFLLFENFKNSIDKKLESIRTGIDIFELADAPHTAKFSTILKRINDMEPNGMDYRLDDSLNKLTKIRNQIQHYGIKIKLNEITNLFENLLPLFIAFIKPKLKPNDRRKIQTIFTESQKVFESDLTKKSEIEFINLLSKYLVLFSEIKFPGKLFSSQKDIVFPKFTEINMGYKYPETTLFFDFYCTSITEKWIIEIKESVMKFSDTILDQVLHYKQVTKVDKVWLIILGDVDEDFQKKARNNDILVTDQMSWNELTYKFR